MLEAVCNGDLPDLRETPIVPADLLVVLDLVAPGQLVDELLVVSDDHQLEVPLPGALVDDVTESRGQTLDVLLVQVGGWFIKGDEEFIDELSRCDKVQHY